MCRLPLGRLEASGDEGRQSRLERTSEDLRGARLGGGRWLSLIALLRNLPAADIRLKGLSRTWSRRLLQEAPDLQLWHQATLASADVMEVDSEESPEHNL
jgi:hypothetical protein